METASLFDGFPKRRAASRVMAREPAKTRLNCHSGYPMLLQCVNPFRSIMGAVAAMAVVVTLMVFILYYNMIAFDHISSRWQLNTKVVS